MCEKINHPCRIVSQAYEFTQMYSEINHLVETFYLLLLFFITCVKFDIIKYVSPLTRTHRWVLFELTIYNIFILTTKVPTYLYSGEIYCYDFFIYVMHFFFLLVIDII